MGGCLVNKSFCSLCYVCAYVCGVGVREGCFSVELLRLQSEFGFQVHSIFSLHFDSHKW